MSCVLGMYIFKGRSDKKKHVNIFAACNKAKYMPNETTVKFSLIRTVLFT